MTIVPVEESVYELVLSGIGRYTQHRPLGPQTEVVEIVDLWCDFTYEVVAPVNFLLCSPG